MTSVCYPFFSPDPRTFLLLDILLANLAEEHPGLLSLWDRPGVGARVSSGGSVRCSLGQADPVGRKKVGLCTSLMRPGSLLCLPSGQFWGSLDGREPPSPAQEGL